MAKARKTKNIQCECPACGSSIVINGEDGTVDAYQTPRTIHNDPDPKEIEETQEDVSQNTGWGRDDW